MENVDKKYRVSYMDTISKETEKNVAVSKTFNSLERATDFVYKIIDDYKKIKLTKLFNGNIEIYRSNIEIEEIITVNIFNKELMVDTSELEKSTNDY